MVDPSANWFGGWREVSENSSYYFCKLVDILIRDRTPNGYQTKMYLKDDTEHQMSRFNGSWFVI